MYYNTTFLAKKHFQALNLYAFTAITYMYIDFNRLLFLIKHIRRLDRVCNKYARTYYVLFNEFLHASEICSRVFFFHRLNG